MSEVDDVLAIVRSAEERGSVYITLGQARVLADEVERLREAEDESDRLRARMAGLLTDVANALKGEPGPLESHDWSDLPAVAVRVMRECVECRARDHG